NSTLQQNVRQHRQHGRGELCGHTDMDCASALHPPVTQGVSRQARSGDGSDSGLWSWALRFSCAQTFFIQPKAKGGQKRQKGQKAGEFRPFCPFCFFLLSTKSEHARSVQYRARKQAAVCEVRRLLTGAVLYPCLNVVWSDLEEFA